MSFLTGTQSTILSAAGIIAVTSGLTAFLGLIKSRLLSGYFGVSPELSIFFTADRIPNLLYSIFVVGALSTVFIPIYSQATKERGDGAKEMASMIITLGMIVFLFLGGFAFIFAERIIRILSVNQFSPEEIILGASLMRIMLGAQIILIISSFITSMLHTHNYFLLPSLAPVFYNLGIITGILLLSEKYGIYGPTYGILIGAGIHLIIQIPALRKIKYRYRFNLNFKDKFVREIAYLMPPRLLRVFITSIMATVHNSLALLISKPSVVHLKFADQLQTFPVSLFGASIAIAALPALSKKAYPVKQRQFKRVFITSLHQMLFLIVPCSVILLILRVPLVRIVYGAARFPWEATIKTSYTLAFFSLSIPMQGAVLLLTRSFYALKDTATPVKIGSITALLNLILCLVFINVLGWGVWSIAFAFSITSGIDMVAMMLMLNKKLNGFNPDKLFKPFIKISYAAVMMGVSLYLPIKFLDHRVFDTTRTLQLIGITGVAGAFGIITYLVLTKILQVEEIKLFYSFLSKIKIKTILTHKTYPKNVAQLEK